MRNHEDYRYILDLFCEDARLEAVYNSTTESLRSIQISPLEGQTLFVLLSLVGAKNVVEIGSLSGYSTVCMARALPDDGVLFSIDISEERCAIARENHKSLGLDHKIQQIQGDAKEKLYGLSGPFDAIFIDGDKGGYCQYLDWAEQNIKQGGLILADNTMLFDSMKLDEPPKNVSTKSWHAMRTFNQRISDKNKYDAIILPMFDGLMVAKKKI